MKFDFACPTIQENLYSSEFGIEKESLRISPSGLLATTPHPFSQPYIDRDFCESQIEIISSVHNSAHELLQELSEIHREVFAALRERGELLWPFSNPPVVRGEEDILIARLGEQRQQAVAYREYLAQKYGKMRMLFSGIHLNFSFAEPLLRSAFDTGGDVDFSAYKDSVYMDLASKLLRYSWLVVYLTAASPVMDDSFRKGLGLPTDSRYASVRCSGDGYWNHFLPAVDFSSVSAYCDSIERYIAGGCLRSTSELYYPIRLKPRGKNSMDALRHSGVNHIELRMLDVNPLSPVGILAEDIEFIHLLILYLMRADAPVLSALEQGRAIADMKAAAMYDDTAVTVSLHGKEAPLRDAAADVLEDILGFAQRFAPRYLPALLCQQRKLSGGRYAEQVRSAYRNYIEDGLKLAEKYTKDEC